MDVSQCVAVTKCRRGLRPKTLAIRPSPLPAFSSAGWGNGFARYCLATDRRRGSPCGPVSRIREVVWRCPPGRLVFSITHVFGAELPDLRFRDVLRGVLSLQSPVRKQALRGAWCHFTGQGASLSGGHGHSRQLTASSATTPRAGPSSGPRPGRYCVEHFVSTAALRDPPRLHQPR